MLMVTQLCGFMSGLKKLTTLSQVLSSVSTASTITTPASILAGDLIILIDHAVHSSAPTVVTPSGYTNIVNTLSGNDRVLVSYKISDGSDSSVSLTGMNGATLNRKAVLVFRGDNAPVVVTGGTYEVTLSAPTNQVQNVAGFTTPVVVLALWGSTGSITTRGMSPAKDGEVNVASNLSYAGWKIYNASPSSTTVSQTDTGTNRLFSCYFQAA